VDPLSKQWQADDVIDSLSHFLSFSLIYISLSPRPLIGDSYLLKAENKKKKQKEKQCEPADQPAQSQRGEKPKKNKKKQNKNKNSYFFSANRLRTDAHV